MFLAQAYEAGKKYGRAERDRELRQAIEAIPSHTPHGEFVLSCEGMRKAVLSLLGEESQ